MHVAWQLHSMVFSWHGHGWHGMAVAWDVVEMVWAGGWWAVGRRENLTLLSSSLSLNQKKKGMVNDVTGVVNKAWQAFRRDGRATGR